MRRGHSTADWITALAAFPPAVWMKMQTYKNAPVARVSAWRLRRRLPNVRFRTNGADLFARAR